MKTRTPSTELHAGDIVTYISHEGVMHENATVLNQSELSVFIETEDKSHRISVGHGVHNSHFYVIHRSLPKALGSEHKGFIRISLNHWVQVCPRLDQNNKVKTFTDDDVLRIVSS